MSMERIILGTALLVVLVANGGCAKKQVLGNLYEGVQMQNRQAAPPEGSKEPTPSYDEYLRQRREAIKEASPNGEPLPAQP